MKRWEDIKFPLAEAWLLAEEHCPVYWKVFYGVIIPPVEWRRPWRIDSYRVRKGIPSVWG